MSHDLLMLRGEMDGVFNLSVGEPVFLQHFLGKIEKHFLTPPDTRYPPFQGLAELQTAIKDYLKTITKYGYAHVVVTVGAKQALCAAFSALKERDGTVGVSHRLPHWPSFNTLSNSMGLEFNPSHDGVIKLNTLINNPDGSISEDRTDVLDCAYASSVYGYTGWMPDHQISVWSPAKLWGLSGLRIGWAATNNAQLAQKMAEYVEKATSGVSTWDQYALLGVLKAQLITTDAKFLLLNNAETFKVLIPYCSEITGFSAHNRGMFNWIKPLNYYKFTHALNKANVKLLLGEACGVPGWYRINMGHLNDYTKNAFNAIRENY